LRQCVNQYNQMAKSSSNNRYTVYTIASLLLLLLCAPCASGQRLTPAQFQQLADACAPGPDRTDLIALARTESSLYPWALSVNRPAAAARNWGYSSGRISLRKQPKTKSEAVRWSQELAASGRTLSVGLLQVNTEDSPHPVEWLLDPCHNLQEGWRIFVEAYRHGAALFGPGQRALLAALGMYNAGSALAGLRNGYFFSILRNSY
jgi:type IV secretion system protein VirB1